MTDLVERVCAIATRSYLAGHGFGRLLVLDGPNGSAVLRYDPTDPDLTTEKARLMAIALQAVACVVVTKTVLRDYEIAADGFGAVLEKLRGLIERELRSLATAMETAGAPWTPGRGLPAWKK